VEHRLSQQENLELMPLVIVDTGVLYAMADRDDNWYEPVKTYLETQTDTLVVSVTVLPEACYLLNTYIGQDGKGSVSSHSWRGRCWSRA
jgi:predicted nucleic acid-binding protein